MANKKTRLGISIVVLIAGLCLRSANSQTESEEIARGIVAVEIQRLNFFTDADSEFEGQVLQTCDLAIKDFSNDLNRLQASLNLSQQDPEVVAYRLKLKLLNKLKLAFQKSLPDSSMEALGEYSRDREQIGETKREILQIQILGWLKNSIALTSDQEEKTLRVFQKKWEPTWITPSAFFRIAQSLETQALFFEDEACQGILTDRQLRFLREQTFPLVAVQTDQIYNRMWDSESFKGLCREVLDLKLAAWQNERLELTTEQVDLLKVASINAVRKTRARWSEANEAFDGTTNGISELGDETLATQLLHDSKLRLKIAEVFGKQTVEKMDEERRLLLAAFRKRMRFELFISAFEKRGIGLTHQQFLQLDRIVENNVDFVKRVPQVRYYFDICRLPDKEFQGVLSESQWILAKPLIHQYRDLANSED